VEFLEPVANLVGLTATQLIVVAIACAALVIGWIVLKVLLKIAMKVFAIGCLTIAAIGMGLYLFFVVLGLR